MGRKGKVLVVGIDGATWKIVKPLVKNGKMPFLKSMIKSGCCGSIISTIPTLTPTAWTSFQTGLNPENHGIFGFIDCKDNPLSGNFYTSLDIKDTKMWDLFSRNGMKSLIMNMPMTYPVKPINGVLISSFLTPKDADYAYPSDLQKELEKIGYIVDYNRYVKTFRLGLPEKVLSKREKLEFVEILEKILKKRVEAFKKLIKLDDFSFIFILIKETDVIQHVLFNANQTKKFYEKVDDSLMEIVSCFKESKGGKKDVLVMSDHGFHKSARLQFSPYVFFKKRVSREVGKELKTNIVKAKGLQMMIGRMKKVKVLNKVYKSCRGLYIRNLEKNALRKFIGKHRMLFSADGVYFVDQKSFSISKINSIVSELRQLEYNGVEVFKKVINTMLTIKGKRVGSLPNIIWVFNEQFVINNSPIEEKIVRKRPFHLKGDHLSDFEGIFVALGDSILKNKNVKINMADLFPLICQILNVDYPCDIDGKLPKGVLKKRDTERLRVSSRDRVRNMIDKQIKEIRQ